jgi:predicted transcriptional regulator
MITIEIKNAGEVIKEKKGRFISLLGLFVDFEKIVEKRISEEIEKSFNKHGIEADINIE